MTRTMQSILSSEFYIKFNLKVLNRPVLHGSQVRLGQVTRGQVRLGQVGLGQVRFGQVRLGQIMLGQVMLRQVRLGQVSLGSVRLGQVRLSQVRLGQVMLGQVRALFHVCEKKRLRPSTLHTMILLNMTLRNIMLSISCIVLGNNGCRCYYRETCQQTLRTLNLPEKILVCYLFLNISFTKRTSVDFTLLCFKIMLTSSSQTSISTQCTIMFIVGYFANMFRWDLVRHHQVLFYDAHSVRFDLSIRVLIYD